MLNMAQTFVTVSAKIPSRLRQKMRRLGIRPSRAFRVGLEEELKKEKIAVLRKKASEMSRILKKIPPGDIVRDIREDRDGR